MSNHDDLKAILDRIAEDRYTKADITALRHALNFSGQQIVLQWGKDNINLGNIGQARDINIGARLYQGADAEEIKKVLRHILEENRDYPLTIRTSNIFIESLFDYFEYEIGSSTKKLLQILFLLLLLSFIFSLIFTSIQIDNNDYIKINNLFFAFISASIILTLFLPWVFRSIHNQRSFWKELSLDEKKIVFVYLTEIKRRLVEKIELNFNAEEDHVALSGKIENTYSHQAYEEKAPTRKKIKDLDRYLLSPNIKQIFIYGSPGSGKSTTLYKAFLNYESKIRSQNVNSIPILIHANEIAQILDRNKNHATKINEFLAKIYQREDSREVIKFVKLLRKKPNINLVIIIDALDEFVDKTKRSQLFEYLSTLMKNSPGETKWLLSCREEEYKAYSNRLNVANVRIQPMDLQQVNKLLSKRLKSLKFNEQQCVSMRRTILSIAKTDKQNETFLKNPYYLSLWLWQLATSSDYDSNIPSINELHTLEIKREISKSINENPTEFGSVDQKLISNTIKVLSVLSFYLLQLSLEIEVHQGLDLNNFKIIQSLIQVIFPIDLDSQDDLTCRRIRDYSDLLNRNNSLISNTPEDNEFVVLVKVFAPCFFDNIFRFDLSKQQQIIYCLIVITSIIDQSHKNRLINCDTTQALLFGFFNQRAADYLAACHLKDIGLTGILKANEINFWLFRAIAIAIAISERPQDVLEFDIFPKDPVFETAIGNGLTLIPSKKKKEIRQFVNKFIIHMMNEERLFSEDYDPCDPLRILREIRRLCLSGYSEHIKLTDTVFFKLLKHKDVGISEMATETLLIYACQVRFRYDLWETILKHLLQKSILFEFGFFNSLIKFWLAIKEI